jgi:ADP-dependent NAD(P)H-hydrate dehydratase / NAD(P)H-hydrate epimerase
MSLLMETAGQAVAAAALRHWPAAAGVLVLCGAGNNGGDGYVAARHLARMGRRVTVLELASDDARPSTDEAGAARATWAALAAGETRPLNAYTLGHALSAAGLVVDALLGSGLTRPLEGDLARLVERLNESGLPILSVDVPSGVPSDFATLPGPHVRATRTVQLVAPKPASALYPAAAAFGAWEVADIGIPASVLAGLPGPLLLDADTVRAHLPARARAAHKYDVGTVLVVAGSPRYLGAAELACRGAYRAGAGLVTLAAEERLAGSWPEIIFEKLEWSRKATETIRAVEPRRAQARVLGPGLDERALPHLPRLLRRPKLPTVLDAGALHPDEALQSAVKRHGGCVLTPHAGEAARLLNADAATVADDPVSAAQRLAEEYGAVIVLKGASTVVAAPDGRSAVSAAGHAGMATGGTGDVLAGVLGAFVAAEPGGDPFGRACAGVYLHGRAGELAGARHGVGLVASDLLDCLGAAWLELGGAA